MSLFDFMSAPLKKQPEKVVVLEDEKEVNEYVNKLDDDLFVALGLIVKIVILLGVLYYVFMMFDYTSVINGLW